MDVAEKRSASSKRSRLRLSETAGRGESPSSSSSAPTTRGGARWGSSGPRRPLRISASMEFGRYSGGTEATAFNPRAVGAIEKLGLRGREAWWRQPPLPSDLRFDAAPSWSAFRRPTTTPSILPRDFAAIMTCSEADEACPVVLGAALRAQIRYEDPKSPTVRRRSGRVRRALPPDRHRDAVPVFASGLADDDRARARAARRGRRGSTSAAGRRPR